MIQDNGWHRHEDDTAFSQKLADDFPITGSTAFDKHKKILNDLDLSNKRTAIDIGAYYGIWSTVLSKDFNKVHAFEPSASNCECFRKNTEDLSNIELYNVAISHRNNKTVVLSDGQEYNVNIFLKDGLLYKQGEIAIMELTDEADHSSFRFIRADIPEIESKFSALTDRSSDIPMKEIDEYDFADVDLINLHTNGSEYLTIMGAINTIQTHRPVIIYQLYEDQISYYSHDESTVNFDSGIRESNEPFNMGMATLNNLLASLGYSVSIVDTFSEWNMKYRIAVPD
jgi:FkbM family methyltransferase